MIATPSERSWNIFKMEQSLRAVYEIMTSSWFFEMNYRPHIIYTVRYTHLYPCGVSLVKQYNCMGIWHCVNSE